MKKWAVIMGILACGFGAFPLPGAAEGGDEAAIREIQARQAEAWNRHDAAAYASLFADDGDVVNVMGWWWRGRPEIESKLKGAFASVFRDSTLTIADVQVRLLSPTAAVCRVRWTMTGAKTPPGLPEPKEGIQLLVLGKKSGRWLIENFQNTNTLPAATFAGGPPPAPGAKP